MKIEIKSPFGSWKIVSKEEAKRYIKFVYCNIISGINHKQKYEYINRKRLRGITAEELLGEVKI